MKRRDYVKAFSPICHAAAYVAWRAYFSRAADCSRWTLGGPPSCGDTMPEANVEVNPSDDAEVLLTIAEFDSLTPCTCTCKCKWRACIGADRDRARKRHRCRGPLYQKDSRPSRTPGSWRLTGRPRPPGMTPRALIRPGCQAYAASGVTVRPRNGAKCYSFVFGVGVTEFCAQFHALRILESLRLKWQQVKRPRVPERRNDVSE